MELNELHFDYAKELFNVGLGDAANELSELVEEEVLMSVPDFRLIPQKELLGLIGANADDNVTAVEVVAKGGFAGNGMLIFPAERSLDLARTLMDDESPLDDLTELEEEALTEISAVILNHIISTICSVLNISVSTQLPTCRRGTWDNILNLSEEDKETATVMFIGMHFVIQSKDLKGDILFIQNAEMIDDFFTHVDNALKEMGVL